MPNAVWDSARDAHARNEPSQMLVVTGPSGCKYLVVALHSAGWQHRVCIPLVGNTTSRWLEALASTKVMQMSIARADSAMSFISESLVPSGAIAQLAAVDTSIPDDLPGFLEELPRTALLSFNRVVRVQACHEAYQSRKAKVTESSDKLDEAPWQDAADRFRFGCDSIPTQALANS